MMASSDTTTSGRDNRSISSMSGPGRNIDGRITGADLSGQSEETIRNLWVKLLCGEPIAPPHASCLHPHGGDLCPRRHMMQKQCQDDRKKWRMKNTGIGRGELPFFEKKGVPLVMDQAGWQVSDDLIIPANMEIVFLPAALFTGTQPRRATLAVAEAA